MRCRCELRLRLARTQVLPGSSKPSHVASLRGPLFAQFSRVFTFGGFAWFRERDSSKTRPPFPPVCLVPAKCVGFVVDIGFPCDRGVSLQLLPDHASYACSLVQFGTWPSAAPPL